MTESTLTLRAPFENQGSSGDRTDSGALYNAITGLGIYGRDINLDYYPNTIWNRRSSKQEQEAMHSQSWLLQKACSAFVMAGLRRWLDVTIEYEDEDFETDLKGVPDDQRGTELANLKAKRKREETKSLDEYIKRLKVREAIQKGEWFSNIFGGAASIVVIEDGRPYNEEVDLDKIKTIRSIRTLDGYNIYPYVDRTHGDPTEVEYYYIAVSPENEEKLERGSGDAYDVRLIHFSRIIRYDGVEITPDEMRRNNPAGWGKSLIDVIMKVLGRYEDAVSGVANMIKFWDLFTYKMKDYARLAGAGELNTLLERFAVMQRLMSHTNGVIMDKDEEASFQTRNYSGLDNAIRVIRDELTAATGIPHTILFGESPSGLGATGESESNAWAMAVKDYQETELRPKIQRILELVFKAKDGPTGGKEPFSWSFEFRSVFPETQKERLEAESLQASNDSVYHSLGVITTQELRTSRFSGKEFSFKTTLDDQAFRLQQEQQQALNNPYAGLFGEEETLSDGDEQVEVGQETETVPTQQKSAQQSLGNQQPQPNAQNKDQQENKRKDSFDSLFQLDDVFDLTNYSRMAKDYGIN